MKRVLALATILMLLLASTALADNMIVVNCDEWVSLRAAPSTSAERLRKVPLYATVTDCQWTDGGFTRCTYDGATGYILDKYLEPLEPDEAESVLDAWVADVNVFAVRQYADGESLVVTGYGEDGGELWSFETSTQYVTELSMTDAFIGGTGDAPRAMVYNAERGLYSLDPHTGEVIWTLTPAEADLGAGITHAVDDDGAMYIAGYYGPDPVCVDADGQVRWQADSGDDNIYWPYEIHIEDRGIVTVYDMMSIEPERSGRVIYDRSDGHVVGMEYDED